MSLNRRLSGFTIVELLVVIVVIGILAAITLVAYNGVTSKAVEAGMKSDLQTAATTLGIDNVNNGSYPGSSASANNGQGLKTSSGNTLSYLRTATGYCAVVSNSRIATLFSITETGAMTSASCLPVITNGSFIQNVVSLNCPTTRTRTVDARDNHTYWVQKMADNKCWMLTNLGYAGGGVNTYGDVRALVNGTADATAMASVAKYYVTPSTTSYTLEPTSPSTATNGTGQYGYQYNFCAANGGQATNACQGTGTTDSNSSVCPANWRLPVASTAGVVTGKSNEVELYSLNSAVNGGLTNSDAGLRTQWLHQYGGSWKDGSFNGPGTSGNYWLFTSQGMSYSSGFSATSVSFLIANSSGIAYPIRCTVV